MDKELDGLKRELESASQATEGARECLESLSKLFEIMGNVKGEEPADLRLRLRQELRRLLNRIDIFPRGRPLYTPERA